MNMVVYTTANKMAKPRVLLVDDEAPLLRAMARLLGPAFAVTVAETREMAIAALEQHEFDLLVCDLYLGVVSGRDVMKVAKERWPEMLRVVLSSAAEEELKALVTEGVADTALAKTLDSGVLITQLNRVLAAK